MSPKPDYGEGTYKGSGKLKGKAAVITGGDSGIGRAVALAFAREGADVLISYHGVVHARRQDDLVALAFAREGADVLISYLNEDPDAEEIAAAIKQEGRKCVLVPGDIFDEKHCLAIIERAVKELGKIDVLVNNAAYQASREWIEDITTEELDRIFKTNVYALFWLCKAAVAHMPKGGSIINTTSIQADAPAPQLLPYAATKAVIQNFTGGLSQMLGGRGIRVNCVAPGPIWTPLIPATMPEEKVKSFGKDTPLGRAGQPAELAAAFVLLASDEASYVSGATIAVTGGKPLL